MRPEQPTDPEPNPRAALVAERDELQKRAEKAEAARDAAIARAEKAERAHEHCMQVRRQLADDLAALRNDDDHVETVLAYGVQSMIKSLRARVGELERAESDMMEERDSCEEWADKLACAVGDIDLIGEHSNLNNPWQNAWELLTQHVEVEAFKARVAELETERKQDERDACSYRSVLETCSIESNHVTETVLGQRGMIVGLKDERDAAVEALRARVAELESERDKAQECVVGLGEHIGEQKRNCDECARLYRGAEADRDSAQAEVARLESERVDLQATSGRWARKARQLDAERERDAAQAEVARMRRDLIPALDACADALDRLMGDSDIDGDDSPEFLACQRANILIDTYRAAQSATDAEPRPASWGERSGIVALTDDDPPRFNAGTRCDMKVGPCACGAWHIAELTSPQPPAPDAEPRPASGGEWWCPHCKAIVPPEDVTHDEQHEACGTPVGGPPQPQCTGKATPTQPPATDDRLRDAVDEVLSELLSAERKFPPFNSAHEGWAVLWEEVDELWDAVRMKNGADRDRQMRLEIVQVAAMSLRFLRDVCRKDRASLTAADGKDGGK